MIRRRPSALVALAGAAAGLGVAYYLTKPGRSLASGAAELESLLTGTIALTDDQRGIVHLIEGECESAGVRWLAPALVANAYAESRLNPDAVGDSGHSIGLFQLYDKGLGTGMSAAERSDPHKNTQAVIREAVRVGLTKRTGLTNAQFASEFARQVEVCSTCGVGQEQYVTRGGLVAKLFGDAVASQVPQ